MSDDECSHDSIIAVHLHVRTSPVTYLMMSWHTISHAIASLVSDDELQIETRRDHS